MRDFSHILCVCEERERVCVCNRVGKKRFHNSYKCVDMLWVRGILTVRKRAEKQNKCGLKRSLSWVLSSLSFTDSEVSRSFSCSLQLHNTAVWPAALLLLKVLVHSWRKQLSVKLMTHMCGHRHRAGNLAIVYLSESKHFMRFDEKIVSSNHLYFKLRFVHSIQVKGCFIAFVWGSGEQSTELQYLSQSINTYLKCLEIDFKNELVIFCIK